MVTNCYWLLRKILDFTGKNIKDPILFSNSVKQKTPLYQDDDQLPSRRTDLNFSTYSAVVGKELICRSDSRFDVWGTKGYGLQVRGRNRRLPGYKSIDLGRGLNSSADISILKGPKILDKTKENSSGNKFLGLLYRDDASNLHLIFKIPIYFIWCPFLIAHFDLNYITQKIFGL